MSARTFTTAEKLAEIDRELKERRRVYVRLVASGKLRKADADRQLLIMLAIRADYAATVEQDPQAAGLLL
jgi:hypothetical protein